MTRPISVVCITRRKGDLLRAAMRAVGDQLAAADELLVVDDGGDDAEIFRRVAASRAAARLRYVSVPHRGYRLSLLCNIGIMLAAHERIVKIDGDVQPRSRWLAEYRRRIEPGSLVCGRIEWRLEDGRLARDSRFDYRRRRGCVGPRKSYGGNLGFMRSDLLALGLFSTAYHGAWGAEDAEIGEKYRLSGRTVMFAFDAAAEHQWHPPSPFRAKARRNRQTLTRRLSAFRRGQPPRPVRRDRLHVVTEEGCEPGAADRLLHGTSLPHQRWQLSFADVARRIDPTEFLLLLGNVSNVDAGMVEGLYAFLKAEESCDEVAAERPERGCLLVRGAAARAMAAPRWGSALRLSWP